MGKEKKRNDFLNPGGDGGNKKGNFLRLLLSSLKMKNLLQCAKRVGGGSREDEKSNLISTRCYYTLCKHDLQPHDQARARIHSTPITSLDEPWRLLRELRERPVREGVEGSALP